MAAVYSLGILTTALASGATFPFWELKTSPLANAYVNEIWATTQDLSGIFAIELQRSATVGVAVGSVPLLAEDPAIPPSLSAVVIHWSTNPVAATNSLRRWSVASSAGNGLYVAAAFPRGLLVNANSSVFLDIAAATGNTIRGPNIFEVNGVVTE